MPVQAMATRIRLNISRPRLRHQLSITCSHNNHHRIMRQLQKKLLIRTNVPL